MDEKAFDDVQDQVDLGLIYCNEAERWTGCGAFVSRAVGLSTKDASIPEKESQGTHFLVYAVDCPL